MRRDRLEGADAALAVIAFGMLALASRSCDARADAVPNPDAWNACSIERQATVMARVAIAEAGWSRRDHIAIGYVNVRRARTLGVDPAEMAVRYSTAARGGHWAMRLPKRRPSVPPVLPRGVGPWWSGGFAGAVDDSRLILAGAIPDPCRGQANHYGAPGANAAAAAARGWKRIDCGPTETVFWFGR